MAKTTFPNVGVHYNFHKWGRAYSASFQNLQLKLINCLEEHYKRDFPCQWKCDSFISTLPGTKGLQMLSNSCHKLYRR